MPVSAFSEPLTEETAEAEEAELHAQKTGKQAESALLETDKKPGELQVDNKNEQEYNEEKARLSEEQWRQLQKDTGWPAEILNYVSSMEEAAIYQKENLKPQKVGDHRGVAEPGPSS